MNEQIEKQLRDTTNESLNIIARGVLGTDTFLPGRFGHGFMH